MITVEKIDTSSRKQVQRFTRLPFQLYRDDQYWVPPILIDHEEQLNRHKHPFYEHSDADFFIAVRDGQDVGRIAAVENRRYNDFHGTRKAQFYFFESEEDDEVSTVLFNRVFEWSSARGLDTVIGPKGLGPLDGYGILIDGFDLHQMMTMMNYNPPYYPHFIEKLGFTKEVDFISCYINATDFQLPERIWAIAKRIVARGNLRVQGFQNIRDLKTWTDRIGAAYNRAFIDNWEYYPLTEREISYVVAKLEAIADPRLIKVILHQDEVVGFLFGFPDIAAAIRRSSGRLFPFGWIRMLLEMKRTQWLAVNTAGILPEYQGQGGNALLYTEMEKTFRKHQYSHAAIYQVAETARDMRRDLETLGVIGASKTHRVYRRSL